MADYIYSMETRLTPDQQSGVNLVQEIARDAGLNLYLTGGTIRDLVTGFPIRDVDLSIQGNPLKLQRELEKAGISVQGVDEELRTLHLLMPGNVRAELNMTRAETYDRPDKPPTVTLATINEDLRRRDFTVNAMALSLNPGSRGLLLDPFNGAADIEAKLIRVLHNYAFVEDPSRLIRAVRFAARFRWPLEERTQARFQSAKENNYIEYITDQAIGREIEQLAYEDDPLHILRALEKEDWLKVLIPHWSTAKVDTAGMGQLLKMRQQMNELGYTPDPAPAVLYFLTARLADKDIADMRKLIPRKDLLAAWKDLEDNAKDLAKRLTGKEAATPSRTWKLLSEARPEMTLFLAVTARQQAVAQKIKNFFTKWRQVQQKLPLLEMTELRITPQMPEYPKIAHDVFMLLLDGKLHSRTEILKFLKPLAPPPPPPPPPPTKRGRAAKAGAGTPQPTAAVAVPATGKKKKGKGVAEVTPAAPLPQPAAKAEVAKAANPPKAEKHNLPKKAARPSKKTTSAKKKAKGKKRR